MPVFEELYFEFADFHFHFVHIRILSSQFLEQRSWDYVNSIAEFVFRRWSVSHSIQLLFFILQCFSVDEKSSKDLRQYLLNLAEQAESNSTTNELPSAIILDNLHLASSLTDVLNSVVGLKSEKYCPYLIGTLNQSNCSSNNLQLHHNFR